MKTGEIFKNKLIFENFAQIFKLICQQIGSVDQDTDVTYHFGCIGGGFTNIPYGQFKLRATRDEVNSLSLFTRVVEPFKTAQDTKTSNEYLVLVVHAKSINSKVKFVFIRRGHMGALTNDRTVVESRVLHEEETQILLFPLDYRTALDVGTEQGCYHFDTPIYGKQGEIVISYNHWYKRIDDRD